MQDERMKVDDDWPKRTKQVNRGIKRDKTSNDENTNKGDQKSGKQQVSREELSEWSGRSVKIEKKDRENEGGSGDKRQQAEHTVIPSQQCCWGCNLTLRVCVLASRLERGTVSPTLKLEGWRGRGGSEGNTNKRINEQTEGTGRQISGLCQDFVFHCSI